MPNQKISELTAIVTVDNSVDVLPIVDISANTTKKVTPNALKTALALDNVNNTSDANKPVSIAQQDALNAKVDENAPIVAATKTKITYDAKGLVTAGDILDAADMPTGINAANIGAGAVSSTEFGYLDGVTSAIQTQIDAKQATLVSGTNIKTINGATVLGAGDITIAGNPPSGVSGAIQFSNGSAFASDAANFFWDDTNNRLGVGTNAPSATGHFKGSGSTSATTSLLVQNSGGFSSLQVRDDNLVQGFNNANGVRFKLGYNGSSGQAISTRDGEFAIGLIDSGQSPALRFLVLGSGFSYIDGYTEGPAKAQNYPMVFGSRVNNSSFNITNSTTQENGSQAIFGYAVNEASAQVIVNSTTRGFLPPRMTTTQKNAIASPAAGLVVYDNTTNKLCCYNGSTWNDLF
jgi:hypothetical protein